MTTRRFIIEVAAGFLVCLGCLALPATRAAADGQRFFHSGDGTIRLVSEKNGHGFEGAYWRTAEGYDPAALKAIHRAFDAPYDPAAPTVSLRLIAFLDFLEDRLNPGALLTITSGYRSPEYNRNVRSRGGLAAKASLHQYGMAADLVMAGVPSERVWETVKALGFGGAGYYHGRTIHLDVGPARSWDETTSGVGTGISDANKLIELVTDYDVYRPGDLLTLRFVRMTAFPIGVVPVFFLEGRNQASHAGKATAFEPVFRVPVGGRCPQFGSIGEMAGIRWQLPAHLPSGRYAVRARFCGPAWEGMPVDAATPAFEVVRP